MAGSVLLVEDDDTLREAMAKYFRLKGWKASGASSVAAGAAVVAGERPDVVIVDYSLPDGSGIDFLTQAQALDAELPVILLTGHGSIDLAVRAVKQGAEQFFTKPADMATLEVAAARALENARGRTARSLRRAVEARELCDPFVGDSPAILALRRAVEATLASRLPLLLLGETGAGKGVLARWIHQRGPRAEEPFVDLNCAGLSRDLVESELFGYERGAFTGATTSKAGLLETAHRGTLFLDEIGELAPEVQAKLLKVLEEQRFRRLGSVRDRTVDVRVVTATNRDLEARSRDGAFREDLYFRISVLALEIPPLRERGDDVVLLAERILGTVSRDLARPPLRLSDGALQWLRSHTWPGNVRELRNTLERGGLFARDGVVSEQDLQPRAERRPAATARPRTLEEAERVHIEAILKECAGHVGTAATVLGLSRSALYEKLRKHGLPSGPPSGVRPLRDLPGPA